MLSVMRQPSASLRRRRPRAEHQKHPAGVLRQPGGGHRGAGGLHTEARATGADLPVADYFARMKGVCQSYPYMLL